MFESAIALTKAQTLRRMPWNFLWVLRFSSVENIDKAVGVVKTDLLTFVIFSDAAFQIWGEVGQFGTENQLFSIKD